MTRCVRTNSDNGGKLQPFASRVRPSLNLGYADSVLGVESFFVIFLSFSFVFLIQNHVRIQYLTAKYRPYKQ